MLSTPWLTTFTVIRYARTRSAISLAFRSPKYKFVYYQNRNSRRCRHIVWNFFWFCSRSMKTPTGVKEIHVCPLCAICQAVFELNGWALQYSAFTWKIRHRTQIDTILEFNCIAKFATNTHDKRELQTNRLRRKFRLWLRGKRWRGWCRAFRFQLK